MVKNSFENKPRFTLFTAEYKRCNTRVKEIFLVFFIGVHKPGALA